LVDISGDNKDKDSKDVNVGGEWHAGTKEIGGDDSLPKKTPHELLPTEQKQDIF